MTIIIKDNIGTNIGGDLIKVNVPHTVELVISDNKGTNVGGNLVNLNVIINSDSLTTFVLEASKHFHELTPMQQKNFNKAVESLRVNDKKLNQTALQWLYDLSVAISGSAIATVIRNFLGISS